MIVYAVELELDVSMRDEYRAWLERHVGEMLELPGFEGGTILTRLDPPPAPGRCVLCVHYRLSDRAAWDSYLEQHAARMRADGLAHFGARVSASRQVLETL